MMASNSNTQRNKITKELVYLRTTFCLINITKKKKKKNKGGEMKKMCVFFSRVGETTQND